MARATTKEKKQSAYQTPERASANLVVRFGIVSIPVAMKPAFSDPRTTVSGTTICPEHREKVSQMYVCKHDPEAEHLMPKGETLIGYESPTKPGTYVTLDDDVLAEIVMERTGTLEIEQFAPEDSLDPMFFEKPYLCWPQTAASAQEFDLLAGALRTERKVAVCRGVMTKKTRTIVFKWSHTQEVMLAHLCSFTSNLRQRDFELAREGAAQRDPISDEHLDLARLLISKLDGDFDPSENEDEYTPLLLEAIRAADSGTELKPAAKAKDKEPEKSDLLAALRASLAEAPGKPAPKKAAAKRKTSKTKKAA